MPPQEGNRVARIQKTQHFMVSSWLLSSLPMKQVCTNNNAAFQCNFLFNIFFFILWMFSVSIELFHQIAIDFTGFAVDFAIFTMWLQTYG